MSNVLLISTNRETLPYAVAPLGLAYLAAVVRAAGHRVRVLDLCFVKQVEKEITKTIREFRPHVIGLSVRNIDNLQYRQSKSYLPFVKSVVGECKKNSNALLILGGTGFSMMPYEIMKYCGASYGVVGDGEVAIVEILERVSRGDRIEGAAGLVLSDPGAKSGNREAGFQKPANVGELDTLPLPLRNIFNNKWYSKWGGMGNIQSKRGCASGCIYCTYPLIEGGIVRCRSPKSVGNELEILQKEYGIKYVYFVDSVFNYPIDHALAISDEIRKRRLTIRWSSYMNPAYVTSELVGAMKAANCSGVEIGTDVASERMLKNMRKNFTVEDIVRCSKLCREADLDFCHYLMLGGPGETLDTLAETVAVMDQVNPTSVVATTGIRLYPGTKLYQTALAEGVIGRGASQDGLLQPMFYLSALLGDALIYKVAEYAKERPHWVIPSTRKNMPTKLFNSIVRGVNYRGPIWRLFKYKKRLQLFGREVD